MRERRCVPLARPPPKKKKIRRRVTELDPKNDAYMRRPDGDMELAQTDFSAFSVPSCLRACAHGYVRMRAS